MLIMRRDVVASRGLGGTFGRRGSTSSLVQMPEKSGLPSAVRGAGADMSTLPSTLRGAPGCGWLIHWAANGVEASAAASMTKEIERKIMLVAYRNLSRNQTPRSRGVLH